MDIKMKKDYVAPKTVPDRFVSESFLCDSKNTGIDSDRIDYGEPEELNW